jgi:hypothetical protein
VVLKRKITSTDMLNDFITKKLPDFGDNNKEISAEEKD